MKETKFALERQAKGIIDLANGQYQGMTADAFHLGTGLHDSYPNPPHKHRDLIIAWANGADIQYRSKSHLAWINATDPQWLDSFIYRIKPAKTPLELKIAKLEAKLAKLKGEL